VRGKAQGPVPYLIPEPPPKACKAEEACGQEEECSWNGDGGGNNKYYTLMRNDCVKDRIKSFRI